MLIPDGKMGDYRQKREENRKKSDEHPSKYQG